MRIPQAPAEKKSFFPLSPDTEISPMLKTLLPPTHRFFSVLRRSLWVHSDFPIVCTCRHSGPCDVHACHVTLAASANLPPLLSRDPLPLPLTSLLSSVVVFVVQSGAQAPVCRGSQLHSDSLPIPSVVTELCPSSRHQRRYESCDCTTLKPQSHTR